MASQPGRWRKAALRLELSAQHARSFSEDWTRRFVHLLLRPSRLGSDGRAGSVAGMELKGWHESRRWAP
jgi:hypothetical protein